LTGNCCLRNWNDCWNLMTGCFQKSFALKMKKTGNSSFWIQMNPKNFFALRKILPRMVSAEWWFCSRKKTSLLNFGFLKKNGLLPGWNARWMRCLLNRLIVLQHLKNLFSNLYPQSPPWMKKM
jgi:hypothetical protein